jgi:HSP20 family protein
MLTTRGSKSKAKIPKGNIIEIPRETDIETTKSTYNNGILEIIFKKKEQAKGKTIKIE